MSNYGQEMQDLVTNFDRFCRDQQREAALQELEELRHMIEAESLNEQKSEEESNEQEFVQQPEESQSNVQRP